MAITNYYNILCVISGLILITTGFVYSSSDPESLCRELSDIAKVGRGEITVSARNHPMNQPLNRCNILPDNREWFVEMKVYKFLCDKKRSYIKFGYIKLCGESVFFKARLSSISMHHNYIKLDSEDQYARITYFRPTDTYNSPPSFARSIPTTKDDRCPSDDEKFYDNYRLVTYNLKTKIYHRSLRCLIEYTGLWQARLQFSIKEASFKCLQSRFTFNNKTTVTGSGFITIDMYEPKLILFIESGCSVDFTLTLTQAVYGRQLPKDTDGDDKVELRSGCPVGQYEFQLNTCYILNNYKSFYNYNNNYNVRRAYDNFVGLCKEEGGQMPGLTETEMEHYFKEPSKIKNQCCVRCQVSKPNYGKFEPTTRYASNYKETDGSIESNGLNTLNNKEMGAVQHVAPHSKTVIITAVGCAIVLLFSTAIVLYIIIKHRRNQKTKLSLANVYVNPQIQKELTIETVSGKTRKSTGESLFDSDDRCMKQPIMDYEKTDLEEDANDINC